MKVPILKAAGYALSAVLVFSGIGQPICVNAANEKNVYAETTEVVPTESREDIPEETETTGLTEEDIQGETENSGLTENEGDTSEETEADTSTENAESMQEESEESGKIEETAEIEETVPETEAEGTEVLAEAAEGVCQIGDKKYPSLEDAVEAANSGDTIILLDNVTLKQTNASDTRYGLWIKKDLVIDGNGKYGIDVGNYARGIGIEGSGNSGDSVDVQFRDITIQSAVGGGRCVDTRGGFLNLTLENATLQTTGGGNTQVITIGGNHSERTKVLVQNSTLIAGDSGYAVITFNPVDLTISASSLSGYACLYMKAASGSFGSKGSVVNITERSELMGNNPHGLGQNSFGTICVDDENIHITVKDSAVGARATNKSNQYIFSFLPNKNISAVVSGDSRIIVDGENAVLFDWYDADKSNSLKLAGGRVELCNGALELTEEEWARYLEAGKTFEKTEQGYVIGDAAQEVRLNRTEIALEEQETIVLKAEILPETAVNQKLTWHSDNENIAVCTDGKITALSKGSCVVTAETGNGVKASCIVTVYELNQPVIPEVDPSVPVQDVTVGADQKEAESLKENTGSIVDKVVSGEQTPQISEETRKRLEEALKDGAAIDTQVIVERKNKDEIASGDIAAIQSAAGSKAAIARYLNLEIVLKENGSIIGEIHQLDHKMKFNIAIPENLKAKDRVFFVVRMHQGQAEKLPTVMNSDGTVSFETDKFSLYALAYENKAEDNGGSGGNGNSGGNESSGENSGNGDSGNTEENNTVKPDAAKPQTEIKSEINAVIPEASRTEDGAASGETEHKKPAVVSSGKKTEIHEETEVGSETEEIGGGEETQESMTVPGTERAEETAEAETETKDPDEKKQEIPEKQGNIMIVTIIIILILLILIIVAVMIYEIGQNKRRKKK